MKFLCPNCKAKYRIGPEKLVGRQVAKIRCRKCDYRIQLTPRPGSDEYDITASPTSLAPTPAALPGSKPAPAAKAVPMPKPAPMPKAVPMPAPRAPAAGAGASRARAAELPETAAAGSRKPTAAVPGLPGLGGLGAPRVPRGTGPRTDALGGPTALGVRRPVVPAPGAAMASAALTPLTAAAAAPAPVPFAVPPPAVPAPVLRAPLPAPPQAAPAPVPAPVPAQAMAPAPAPVRPAAAGTQLADQFRQSVQAGGAAAGVEEGPQDGWFVGVNGVPLGPIPVGDLRELAAAGHVDRKSLVWREGQAEWRPLGKFPHLARVLDDGASPSVRPAPAEPEPVPMPARASTTDVLVATGFDGPRPAAPGAERPSAWGDLDDEDDGDEQPTTVKGRVSLLPPGPSGAPPSSMPPPAALPGMPPPAAFRTESGGPVPALGQGPVSSTGAVSVPPSAADRNAATRVSLSAIAREANEVTDARALRPGARNKLVYAAIVVAALVFLGVLKLLWPSTPPAASPAAPARTLAPAEKDKAAAPPAPPEPSEPAPAKTEPGAGEPPIAQQAEAAEAAPVVKTGLAIAVPSTPSGAGAAGPTPTAPAKSAPSLLSGLNTLQTPGPAAGARAAGSGAGGGVGLDATAIQRTVRRYSPAVRQNCWQRALNARAPGVPSSAKVTATINVDPSGRVQSVTASGAPRGYPGLAHCIEDAVRGWAFPRSSGETVTNVPFMFVGQ